MSERYTAIIRRIDDVYGVRAVVTHADPVIWIADELMDYARDPTRERITGDIEVDGDRISFGTDGEGLGRLTYRLVGRLEMAGFHVAKRERTGEHRETT